jgi:hypothetical protein
MSATITRLILSFIALVAAPAVYTVLFIISESGRFSWSDEAALMMCNVLVGLGLTAGWCLIWRGEVRWTPARAGLTLGFSLMALVAAVVVGIAVISLLSPWAGNELGIVFGGITWGLLWPVAAALAWRETPAERTARLQRLGVRAVACPKCGYNLTGLRTSECPECGTVYTLDQLFAALAEERGTLPEETRV